jgi:glycosyltransferase involved in cell wall biosynthesis
MMTYPYKTSVIIPTYNRAEVLPSAIESLLTQTYKDFEIIIVDDGSTDNTRKVLESYLAKPNIRYVYQENQKQAAARNNGICHSRSEYLAFLDSDDLWYPEKLDLQVKALDEHPDVGMVYSNQMMFVDDMDEGWVRYARGILKSGDIFKDLLQRKFYCSLQTVLVRRTVFDEVGLMDESLKNSLEDWELTLRIARKYRILAIDKPLVRRRVHEETSLKYLEFRINNHWSILKKHLKEPSLEPEFVNRIWRKAYYSWGHDYLAHGSYGKALRWFRRALRKGNLAAGIGIAASLLGPVGRGLFRIKKSLR